MYPDFAAVGGHVNPYLAALERQRAHGVGAAINDADAFAFEVGGINLTFIRRHNQHPRAVLIELPIAHDPAANVVYFDHCFRWRAGRPQPSAVAADSKVMAAIIRGQFNSRFYDLPPEINHSYGMPRVLRGSHHSDVGIAAISGDSDIVRIDSRWQPGQRLVRHRINQRGLILAIDGNNQHALAL